MLKETKAITPIYRFGAVLIAVGLFSLLTGGCVQTRITEPKRSAVEQLLLSTAADRALTQADFRVFQSKPVYIDDTYLDSYDHLYVLGTLRDALSSAGALLVDSKTNSEAIVEIRSGALSTDSSESIVGLPRLPVPIPFAGSLETPELSLFKSQKQFGTAKLAVLGYWTQSRKHAQSTGPLVGRSRMNYYIILGYFKFTSTDIPEKMRKNKSEAKRPE